MADHLYLTMNGIDWNLSRLKRFGPDKGGHWEVI